MLLIVHENEKPISLPWLSNNSYTSAKSYLHQNSKPETNYFYRIDSQIPLNVSQINKPHSLQTANKRFVILNRSRLPPTNNQRCQRSRPNPACRFNILIQIPL